MIPASLRSFARRHGYAIRRTREIAGVETFLIVDIATNAAASSSRLVADDVRGEVVSLVEGEDAR
ncbi:hypothetical protein [Agrobacterium burrii]|uniref:Uncharacterized protein n=1 Tax=Agrobacterium burrii TaxID=2815339 RepID=A0ABS3ED93_9HYPH|nr:hypothetical protein [Agrobacterium burrii]MBO0129923.1 hypothetical protein [Agrobacterium burrii]